MDHEDHKPCTEELQRYLDQSNPGSNHGENIYPPETSAPDDLDSPDLDPCNEAEPFAPNSNADLLSYELGNERALPLCNFVTVIALRRGNGKGYVIQDYIFIKDRVRNGNMYLKCRNRSCKARAIISRLNQVSLAGSRHDPLCHPTGLVKTYSLPRRILPHLDTNTDPPYTTAELTSLSLSKASDAEVGELQQADYHQLQSSECFGQGNLVSQHQETTGAVCSSINIDDFGQDSLVSSYQYSSMSATPSRTMSTPQQLTSQAMAGKCSTSSANKSVASTNKSPYPIRLNASEKVTTMMVRGHEAPHDAGGPFSSLRTPAEDHTQSKEHIQAIFRAFRDLRHKVTLLKTHQV